MPPSRNGAAPQIDPRVLRNRGFPVRVGKLEATNGPPELLVDVDGVPVEDEKYINFTFDSLVEIETHFGNSEQFQKAMAGAPLAWLAKVYSIAWNLSESLVRKVLLPEHVETYVNAAFVAWQMAASQMDPPTAATALETWGQLAAATTAKKSQLMREAITELAALPLDEINRIIDEEAKKRLSELRSTGTAGSDSGSTAEEPSTPSGP